MIPGSGRPPGGRNGNPLQYSCLENPHGQRSLGWEVGATVHGVAHSWQDWSDLACMHAGVFQAVGSILQRCWASVTEHKGERNRSNMESDLFLPVTLLRIKWFLFFLIKWTENKVLHNLTTCYIWDLYSLLASSTPHSSYTLSPPCLSVFFSNCLL